MFKKTYCEEMLAETGKTIADILNTGVPLLLYGEMGAGKTTLTKHIIKSLGCNEEVTSPTFNIMQNYKTTKGNVWHVDLYRLKNVFEVEDLGIFEMFKNNIFIIEWPERIENYVSKPHLKAVISILNEKERTIEITEIT